MHAGRFSGSRRLGETEPGRERLCGRELKILKLKQVQIVCKLAGCDKSARIREEKKEEKKRE